MDNHAYEDDTGKLLKDDSASSLDSQPTVSIPYPLAPRRSLVRYQSQPLQVTSLPRHESESLKVTSQHDLIESQSTSDFNKNDITISKTKSLETNYPTMPVFTMDSGYKRTFTNKDLTCRSSSTNLPENYRKPTPGEPMKADKTTSRLCNCQCHCADIQRTMNEASRLKLVENITSRDLTFRWFQISRAKLKAAAMTSRVMAGFALGALAQMQINVPTIVPEWLLILFSGCTTILIALNIFALTISTYLLPNMLDVCGLLNDSPHERMRVFIELAWASSTVLCLFLFILDVGFMGWVKFLDYSYSAAWISTVTVIPVLLIFIAFAVYFYHNLVTYKVKSSTSNLIQMEKLSLKLNSSTISKSGEM